MTMTVTMALVVVMVEEVEEVMDPSLRDVERERQTETATATETTTTDGTQTRKKRALEGECSSSRGTAAQEREGSQAELVLIPRSAQGFVRRDMCLRRHCDDFNIVGVCAAVAQKL